MSSLDVGVIIRVKFQKIIASRIRGKKRAGKAERMSDGRVRHFGGKVSMGTMIREVVRDAKCYIPLTIALTAADIAAAFAVDVVEVRGFKPDLEWWCCLDESSLPWD